jgi:uncharacterized protein
MLLAINASAGKAVNGKVAPDDTGPSAQPAETQAVLLCCKSAAPQLYRIEPLTFLSFNRRRSIDRAGSRRAPMSDRKPLMPKATAVWLVENTSLSFDQIAVFCAMHLLEVKGIADGDVAAGIKGMDPIASGQLTREEIKRCEENEGASLRLAASKVEVPPVKTKKGPKYTPLSRRHDRPNAVLWLLRNHPELKDTQLMRLVGTTKPTIAQIRDRTHWNSPNLVPQDPVTMGLCSQVELDAEVNKSAARAAKERRDAGIPEPDRGGTLLPTAETTGFGGASIVQPKEKAAPKEETEAEEQARMLAKLKALSGGEKAAADED